MLKLEERKSAQLAADKERLTTEKKQVMDELVDHAKHFSEMCDAKKGVEVELTEVRRRSEDLQRDRDWYRVKTERLNNLLIETQEALRTLATTTGRIGKADDVRQVSYTDTTSH